MLRDGLLVLSTIYNVLKNTAILDIPDSSLHSTVLLKRVP
jgi:hypothetical protein